MLGPRPFFFVLLSCCILLLLQPVIRADVLVTAVKLDGSEVSGRWAAVGREGSIAIRTDTGEEIFATDELLSVRPLRVPVVDRSRRWPVTIWTAGGSVVPAEILSGAGRTVHFRTPLVESWELSLDQLAAVRWNEHRGFSPPFETHLQERNSKDHLLAIREQRINVFAGSLESLEAQGGSFRFKDSTVRFTPDQAWGVVLAAPPQARRGVATCILDDEHRLAGTVLSATPDALILQSDSATVVSVPLEALRELRIASSRVFYLSELKPAEVEQRSFFDVPWPVRIDRSASNGPLSVRGRFFDRGIGVHARCALTFDLPDGYERLAATVGIDDATRGQGQLQFVVLDAGGRELLRTAALDGEAPPLRVSVDVASLSRVTLLVEAAGPLDIGGHADWAEVRLIR